MKKAPEGKLKRLFKKLEQVQKDAFQQLGLQQAQAFDS